MMQSRISPRPIHFSRTAQRFWRVSTEWALCDSANGHRLYRAVPGSVRAPAGAQSVAWVTRRDARLTPSVASEGKSIASLTPRDARLAPSVTSEGKSVASLTPRDARLAPSVASEGKSVASLTPSEASDTLGFDRGRWGCHGAGFCWLHGC